MDASNLIITLKSISSDSNKNSTLKNIIFCVNNIQWDQLVKIIYCYSSDSYKIDALKIVCSNNNIDEKLSKIPFSDNICQILKHISADSYKVDAVKILSKYFNSENCDILIGIIENISSDSYKIEALKYICLGNQKISATLNSNNLCQILRLISSDSYKIEAVKILSKYLDGCNSSILIDVIKNISSDNYKIDTIRYLIGFIKIDESHIPLIVKAISSDSYRSSAVSYLSNKLDNISGTNLLDIIKNISTDSYKIEIIKSFQHKMACDSKISFNIIQLISTDDSKLKALIYFINRGLIITHEELLEYLSTFSTVSAKTKCLLSFKNFEGQITDQNEFCKTLAKGINDTNLYLKSANHLSLDEKYIETYKPKERSIESLLISLKDEDEDDDYDDFFVQPGLEISSYASVKIGKKITKTMIYSDGSVHKIVKILP